MNHAHYAKPMDYAKGTHKGFAFVEYSDADDANEAIYNLDGSELNGRSITVNLAQHNQLNLNSHKAVWSTDDFFQSSQEAHADVQKKKMEDSLKEGGKIR